jgi:hypothetical protein
MARSFTHRCILDVILFYRQEAALLKLLGHLQPRRFQPGQTVSGSFLKTARRPNLGNCRRNMGPATRRGCSISPRSGGTSETPQRFQRAGALNRNSPASATPCHVGRATRLGSRSLNLRIGMKSDHGLRSAKKQLPLRINEIGFVYVVL